MNRRKGMTVARGTVQAGNEDCAWAQPEQGMFVRERSSSFDVTRPRMADQVVTVTGETRKAHSENRRLRDENGGSAWKDSALITKCQ